jgi:hypothetical protein
MTHAALDEHWIFWLLNQKCIIRPSNKKIEEYMYANILTKKWYEKIFEKINIEMKAFEIKNTNNYDKPIDIISWEEIFARMVDSLISGYNWELIQDNYPLNEKDLKFLEKFKKDWKTIFWEHIKKYRDKYLKNIK